MNGYNADSLAKLEFQQEEIKELKRQVEEIPKLRRQLEELRKLLKNNTITKQNNKGAEIELVASKSEKGKVRI